MLDAKFALQEASYIHDDFLHALQQAVEEQPPMHINPNKGDPISKRLVPLLLSISCVFSSFFSILGFLILFPVSAIQISHYFWWWLIPAVGIDLGASLMNFFDVLQLLADGLGLLISAVVIVVA